MHVLNFYIFSQIWNMRIINILHNSKTSQQVEMLEVHNQTHDTIIIESLHWN